MGKISEVYNEDVFETMKRIKDKSVNLIICDGPYFKICGKFDWAFKTMQEWIDWHILLRDEFERILADNGSLFVFGDEKNIAYLQVEFDKKFNLLNNIVYRKINPFANKGLANFNIFAPVTERILFYDKGENKTGLEMISRNKDNWTSITNKLNNNVTSREQIYSIFRKDGRYKNERSVKTHASFKFGYGSRFDLMDKKLFNLFKNELNYDFTYEDLRKEYEDLRKEYEDLRKEYEDLRRPFNNQFKLTDVIDCKTQSTFHPTTKDLKVIEKLILTTTKEDDLIFSPFLGSGTDRIAAHNTKRGIISCEIDKEYFDKAEHRYQEHIKQLTLF